LTTALEGLALPITTAAAVGTVTLMSVAYWWPGGSLLYRRAALVLLTFLLGPGIVINSVLKVHTGRPRPIQVEQLGGRYEPVPVLVQAHPAQWNQCRSFPSGHASVGYALCAGWFLWRRSRRGLAAIFLVGSLAVGSAIGLARMAAGAHHLSDIIWAAGIVYLVALWTYAGVLRLPQLEHAIRTGEHPPA
jgi:membrane-associated PAP2 superfamily phosphatase